MEPEFITVTEASKRLDRTVKTVYDYLADGTLTRYRKGHRTYIDASEVAKVIEDRETIVKAG